MIAHYETIKGVTISIEDTDEAIFAHYGALSKTCDSLQEAKFWVIDHVRSDKLLTDNKLSLFINSLP